MNIFLHGRGGDFWEKKRRAGITYFVIESREIWFEGERRNFFGQPLKWATLYQKRKFPEGLLH